MDALLISISVMLIILIALTLHENYAYDYSICGKFRKNKKTNVKQVKTKNGWEIMK